MLKLRVLTAAILIPVILIGLFYLPLFWFAWASVGIFALGAWEWAGLINIKSWIVKSTYIVFFLIICWLLGRDLSPSVILSLAVITWGIIFYFAVRYESFKRLWPSSEWFKACIGIWILSLAWYGINFVRWQENGIFLLLILFLLVWGADTGGYFIGRRWGKHKLAAEISPGKTIEGVMGGMVLAILIVMIAAIFLPFSLTMYVLFILLSVLTILVSVLGDLFESMVKRQSGAKDSGQWLPGHGGILDRIDSVISAAPFYAAGILLLEQLNGFFM